MEFIRCIRKLVVRLYVLSQNDRVLYLPMCSSKKVFFACLFYKRFLYKENLRDLQDDL